MGNRTYEAYRSDPAVREQLEREARELQTQEVNRLILAPLARWLRQTFTHAQLDLAHLSERSASPILRSRP